MALPPVTHSSALQAPERMRDTSDVITFQALKCLWFLFLPRIERIGRIYVLWGKEEIKKFVALPGLTPLQPDAYAHPCKRASLADHPHPSGLPIGRRKINKTK